MHELRFNFVYKQCTDLLKKKKPKKQKVISIYLITLKNFSVKDAAKRMKRQPTNWEKIFAKDISDKG